MMFFVLAKIIGFIIKPFTMMLILIGATLSFGHMKDRASRRRRRTFRLLYRASMTALILWIGNLMMPIIPYLTVSALEGRFTQPDIASLDPDVIIILGGWQGNPNTMQNATTPPISSSGDRLITGLILAERFPYAMIALPGGLTRSGDTSEADISHAVLDGLGYTKRGIDRDRFIIEGLSRNTAENAVYLRDMLKARGSHVDGQIVLVTSAWHMPRAMGAFRAAGLEPIAFPVDYTTSKDGIPLRGLFLNGFGVTHRALREVIGLIAYRLTGRTDQLIPKP